MATAVLVGAITIPQTIEANSNLSFSDLGFGYELRTSLMNKNIQTNAILFLNKKIFQILNELVEKRNMAKTLQNKKIRFKQKRISKKGKVNENKYGEGKYRRN